MAHLLTVPMTVRHTFWFDRKPLSPISDGRFLKMMEHDVHQLISESVSFPVEELVFEGLVKHGQRWGWRYAFYFDDENEAILWKLKYL